MSRLSAKQIVSRMLEDYAGDFEGRAGGPKDIWRQGGFKNFSLKGKNFGGKRPGEGAKPDGDDDEEKETKQPGSRFAWKPKSDKDE